MNDFARDIQRDFDQYRGTGRYRRRVLATLVLILIGGGALGLDSLASARYGAWQEKTALLGQLNKNDPQACTGAIQDEQATR